jgi:hypothetical protein
MSRAEVSGQASMSSGFLFFEAMQLRAAEAADEPGGEPLTAPSGKSRLTIIITA